MKLATEKLTLRTLRMKMVARGCFSIAELARQIDCSRAAVYFALERPSRYPTVFQKIMEFIQ